MRALTVRQPWAWAIVHGGKDVENRTAAWSYRGPLAIHSGGSWSERGGESDLIAKAWAVERRIKPEWGDKCYPLPRRDLFPTSAVIGVVNLVGAHQAEDGCCHSPWAEREYLEAGGKVRRDLAHLVLEDPRALPAPIPAKGRLGLWTPDPDLLATIQEELR